MWKSILVSAMLLVMCLVAQTVALYPDGYEVARVNVQATVRAQPLGRQSHEIVSINAGSLILVKNAPFALAALSIPSEITDNRDQMHMIFRRSSSTTLYHTYVRLTRINVNMFNFHIGKPPFLPPLLPASWKCLITEGKIKIKGDDCNVAATIYQNSLIGVYDFQTPKVKCGVAGFDVQYLDPNGPGLVDISKVKVGFVAKDSLASAQCYENSWAHLELPIPAPWIGTHATPPGDPKFKVVTFDSVVDYNLL